MGAELWTDEFLASMRQVMDPEADAVVKRLFEEGGLDKLKSFHGHILRHDGIPEEGLPPYVIDYLRATSDPPEWTDRDAVAAGQSVLASNGMIAFAILGCAALPECYVDRPGVHVLWLTQNINAHVYRRIFETAQFVLGVLTPGGLERNGKGIQAAQKVRLMHASVRYLMLAQPDEKLAEGTTDDISEVFRNHQWRTEFGMPINHEDLAYTLQTFAWVGVRGMRSLGCNLTPAQEEGVIHAWNVAGHVMGIRRDLMPANVKEAELLFEKIKSRLAAPSEGGTSMELSLLNLMESQMPGHLTGVRHLPRMLTRYLVGDKTADLLGVPAVTWWERAEGRFALEAFERIQKVRNRVFDDAAPMRKVAELVFLRMAGKMMALPPQWDRELFQLPQQLASTWEVERLAPETRLEKAEKKTIGVLTKIWYLAGKNLFTRKWATH
jgi:hypothetical protein